MHWLLTRPQPECDVLLQRMTQAGFAATAAPAIQIQPLAIDHRVIMELDHFDTLIVVSKPAARRLIDEVDMYWPQLPIDQRCIAVGPGTAQILSDYGFAPQVPDQADSEGVLALCGDAKTVLLAAGAGGREAIEQGLTGCDLTRLSLYRRAQVPLPPNLDGGVLTHIWVTSADIADVVAGWNLELPIWVPSERVATHARGLGLTVQRVLGSAQDAALLDVLQKEAV